MSGLSVKQAHHGRQKKAGRRVIFGFALREGENDEIDKLIERLSKLGPGQRSRYIVARLLGASDDSLPQLVESEAIHDALNSMTWGDED